MSLYYSAASFLAPSSSSQSGSLKSRIFASTSLAKSSPATIYALVTETAKYSPILKEVIDNAGILEVEPKLNPALALLLVHDVLLSKNGIAAPTSHPLRLAVQRHKVRLKAELHKSRVRHGCANIDELKDRLEKQSASNGIGAHPRWIRINTLKTLLEEQLQTTYTEYTRSSTLDEVIHASPGQKSLYIDPHIPSLIAIPHVVHITKTLAYRSGELILQDKASCFPAHLLIPPPSSTSQPIGDVLDACAAPGNKTTHLAAILAQHPLHPSRQQRCIFAVERSPTRSITLSTQLSLAGADRSVTVFANQDFLALDPHNPRFRHVTHLLLDPSCSGSGIVGRDDVVRVSLPEDARKSKTNAGADSGVRGTKRKRFATYSAKVQNGEAATPRREEPPQPPLSSRVDPVRLGRLASLQCRMLEHTFRFPAARRVSYSTCSVHRIENEDVVAHALAGNVARERGWRVLRREELVDGLRDWAVRGEMGEGEGEGGGRGGRVALSEEEREACIRCTLGDGRGTMGFFVCGFVRDGNYAAASSVVNADEAISVAADNAEGEWEGFGD